MSEQRKKSTNRISRMKRTRTRIKGTEDRPRLNVTISNMHISAQIINDDASVTITSATTVGSKATGSMTQKAEKIGADIAKAAQKESVRKVVFDRGAKQYHGRIKALADAARAEGLEF